jgi:excisionase family DNA binding protein
MNARHANGNSGPQVIMPARRERDAERTGRDEGRSLTVRKLLLAPADAADALSISERTLWQLTKNGEILAVAIGRLTRYRVRDLQAFVAGIPVRTPRPRPKQQEDPEP